ncbi:hypothetical protein Tco_0347967 [Tanacetum coccineum]
MVAFQAELQATKGLIQVGRYDGGVEIASPIPRSMRLDMPKFSGTDPDQWIFSITEYFTLLSTPMDQQLRVSVRNRFGPCKYEDPQGVLSKLFQKGMVEQYQGEFEKLMHWVTDISAGLLITFYVSGLKPSVQRDMLVAKPTSLGDAFSLVRVTKSRLEDQGVTLPTSRLAVASGSQTMTKTTLRFIATRLENPKPPLLSTPVKVGNNSGATPLPIKWISPAERQDCLNQGLCFNYDNKVRLVKCIHVRWIHILKVKVGERQRAVDEPKLLDTTVGRVVPLPPIAPARAESELDASVDMLFDEGGSGNLAEQGDSASGGHGVGIPLVSEAAETFVEDVAPVQPRRQRKRKTVVPDAGGPSHPPKKLREDHRTLSVNSVGDKSRSVVQRLLARAVQNVEVRGEPIPNLPFVTSYVSATPKHEDEVNTNSATCLNLRTIGAPQRFVISLDSSHHSGDNIAEAEVDSFARPSVLLMRVATTVTSTVDQATTVKEKFVEFSVFGGDSFGGGADHTVGGFSDLTGSDFIVGGIRTVISTDTDLQKVYVPQWSVTNGSRLDDGRTCREMVDEFAPPKFFASIRVRMHAEYNIRERRRLNSVVEEKNSLLKARNVEIETPKAQLLVKEAEAAKAICLRTEASKFEVVEKSLRDEVNVLKEQNAALEQESTDLGVKVADLVASVKVREQEVADLDA